MKSIKNFEEVNSVSDTTESKDQVTLNGLSALNLEYQI